MSIFDRWSPAGATIGEDFSAFQYPEYGTFGHDITDITTYGTHLPPPTRGAATSVITYGGKGTLFGATLRLEGWNIVRANLQNIALKYPEEMGFALKDEGYQTMTESIRICPYDQNNPHEDGTPHLRDTASVSGPYFDADGVTVVLGYNTPYAVLQHEVMEYRHDPPEQWKYLESPVLQRSRFIAINLVKSVNMQRMVGGIYVPKPTAVLEREVRIPLMEQRAWAQYNKFIAPMEAV